MRMTTTKLERISNEVKNEKNILFYDFLTITSLRLASSLIFLTKN